MYALLDKGIDIDGTGFLRHTPLMVVAYWGDVEATRQLIARGASVHRVIGPGRRNALYHALQNNHLECSRLLIEAGADVNSPDPSGETLLMSAVIGEAVEVVRFLLDAGANVNAQDDIGMTALERAMWKQTHFWNEPRVAVHWKDQDLAVLKGRNEAIIAILQQAGATT